MGDGATATWLTVVGVARDVHLPGTTGDLFNLQMYRPTSAAKRFVSYIMLRVSAGTGALEPALHHAVESAGVSATVGQVRQIESVIDGRVLARPQLRSTCSACSRCSRSRSRRLDCMA